jgi:hypothetical protein
VAVGTDVSHSFSNGAEVLSIESVDYHASAPAGTTDLYVYDTAKGQAAGLIYGKTDSSTDVTTPLRPRVDAYHDTAGAALTANEVTERLVIPAGGSITAKVDQCNALTAAAVVVVRVLEY